MWHSFSTSLKRYKEMGLLHGVLTLLLLMTFHTTGSQRDPCQSPEVQCDFVCDCNDCNDELDCGYRGREFVCDFEEPACCGWKDQSLEAGCSWERRQRGDALPDSGPSSDFTTGTASGWFMGVTSVQAGSPATAVLVSPVMRQSSPTCRLHLRYFLWDSGHTGLGAAPLWASLWREEVGQEAVVWRPEGTSVRGWREATVFLGRVPSAFQIRLHSRRDEGRRGDVAVDQLEFLDCALPQPPQEESCAAGMLQCKNLGCVAQRQVCDGTDDCGDRTDEENCGGYWSCDFEEDLCDWDLRSLSPLRWKRTNQMNISLSDPRQGPGRDHSNNTASGHFLYVTAPESGLKADWAAFQTPFLDPTNSTHPCKVVMYTHQFGPRAGGLSALVADREIYPVWERGGALGDLWVKGELEVVTNMTFKILFVAAIRDEEYGGIAVDSITMSPECQISKGNNTAIRFPKPPPHPCTESDRICDFHVDCPGAQDEAKCGDFSYEGGSSGWTDNSIGGQGWQLKMYNATTKDQYLCVAQAPGQQLSEAQTRTPLLGPSGPACTLSFSFSLTGPPVHIGELSVRVIDSLLGEGPRLWEYAGKTGSEEEEEAWLKEEIHLGVWDHRFQLEFLARSKVLGPDVQIAVKDVRFVNCHPDYFQSSSTELSCNFDEGLCDWYQDHTDNFDWTVRSGMDHSTGIGKSLVVDMWSPSLRGLSGRLVSFPQPRNSQEHCLYFYYRLYGPDTGELNVKLHDAYGYEVLLWSRGGPHGNMWHEGHCPVAQQLTSFQLVFEAVRSGFDGQVALDDVVFYEHPCSMPRACSFEGRPCGFTSYGPASWRLQSGFYTSTGPKTDHTLETEMGYYMMADSDAEVLPQGAVSTLTSPLSWASYNPKCVNFWYHMGGKNPGSFSVYVKPVKGERVKIFSNIVSQGGVWRHGNGNISVSASDWQLEFEVEGAGGTQSHVALDDVILSNHPCHSQGGTCDLERDLCGWTNTQNTTMDKLDWELTSAEAESHYPTPPWDHTLGNKRGHFLFLPSSTRNTANHNAQLLSPHLPTTKGTCLYFWAHKPSSGDSYLKVLRLSGGQAQQLLEVREVTSVWKRFDINITSAEEYQIVFEGFKGTSGVFALDDIRYTVGFNCAGTATDPLPTHPPDNAGGIAASVIVLLLLVATLAGVLCYFLRAKKREGSASQASCSDQGFSNDLYDQSLTDPTGGTRAGSEIFSVEGHRGQQP
ncbi:apical endosomal glycoprotein [Osmerus mordax]|uniref:apical endosomal glycoprotein n=1 Tax=Osmerus mordax TaxID=8014 RepID=UPI00350F52B3